MAIYSYKKENGDIVSSGYDYEDGYTPLLPEGYEYDSKNKEVIKKADYVAPEKTEKSTESSGVYGGNSGNVYDTSYSSLVSQYMNPTAFSYDYENDPLYQNYLESYTRQGKTAMENTLAQVSARTGGLASSYATQAAQGTYNNYLSQAADKIPELYSMRYNEWLDQQNLLKNQISLAQDIDNTNYSRQRDTISDQRYDSETAYDQNLSKAQTLADYGDFSGYKALGYTDEQIDAMQKKYNSSLYSGSGESNLSKLKAIAEETGLGDDWYNYYKARGWTDAQIDAAMYNQGFETEYGPYTLSENSYNQYKQRGGLQDYSSYSDYLKAQKTYTARQTETQFEGIKIDSTILNELKTAYENDGADRVFEIALATVSPDEVEGYVKAAGVTNAEFDRFMDNQ